MSTNESNKDPKYVACLLDWSDGCSPEFLERCGGKLYLSGFYDDSVNHHCCSVTPSVWVLGLEAIAAEYPEDEEAREALYEELREVMHSAYQNQAADAYYTRSSIEAARKANPDNFRELDVDFDFEDPASNPHACEDQVREELSADPVFC